jgi:polyprenyl-phospho-N-acetylgalactosaminyl synthase
MKTLVVIPAYNEAQVIGKTIKGLLDCISAGVLVVDDGSVDATSKAAVEAGASVVRHPVNLGLGASLETGFEYARRFGFDSVVSFDADGQHSPPDVGRLLDALGDSDLVVGVRAIDFSRMPHIKRLGNAALNLFTKAIFGVSSRDSQSGLRALNRRALNAINLRSLRYAVSSEILYEAYKAGLRVSEVEVHTIYTSYSLRRGTGVFDGLNIVWRMIIHRR